ncbi:MAG: putative Ig domain-containing protein, partial [Pirellula sp.]|nr:putative Ig domain-containing protein [Pirellula sp.]
MERPSGTSIAPTSSFTLNADNRFSTGLAMRGTRLWVTDLTAGSSGRVFVYETSGICVGFWTLSSGNTDPTGITVNPNAGAADGNDVWVVDRVDKRVYRYNGAASATGGSPTLTTSWITAAANSSPEGIADPPPPLSASTPVDLVDAGLPVLVSGQTDPGAVVTIGGLGPSSMDATGNFFYATTVPAATTTVPVVARKASDSSTVTLTMTSANEMDLRNLIPEKIADLNVIPSYGRTSFFEKSKTLFTDITLTNNGTYDLKGPLRLGIRNLSRSDVTLTNADGYAGDRVAFIDLASAIANNQLLKGSSTATVTLEFHNPSEQPFTYELVLFSEPNAAPAFVTAPVVTVRAGKSYSYASQGLDPNGDAITYSIIEGPQGFSIDGTTGVVSWSDSNTAANVGSHRVTLAVQDALGLRSTQSFTLSVLSSTSVNRPPEWTSTPIVQAFVNTPYEYDANASDPNNDTLTYSLTLSPGGMSIGSSTGLFSWKPSDAQLGIHTVVVRVTDNGTPSLYTEQSFQILVSIEPGNRPPVIVSSPSIVHNAVSPGPVVGNVTPTSPIIVNLADGQVSQQTVTFTRQTSLPKADVLFLLDDTASIDMWGEPLMPGAPSLRSTIQSAINNLDSAYPSTDFAFGIARMENFALSVEFGERNRPYILNQPVIRKEDANFDRFIELALNRRSIGSGAGTVSVVEALYQAATGVGLDYGRNDVPNGHLPPTGAPNGSAMDNGHSLDISSQTAGLKNGDIAPFNTPRSFSYRLIRTSDLAPLNVSNTATLATNSGSISVAKEAKGWTFTNSSAGNVLRLSPVSDLSQASWNVFDTKGVRLASGPASQPIQVDLTQIGSYVVILDSESSAALNYEFGAAVLPNATNPITLGQLVSGNIAYAGQIDRYSLNLTGWKSLYLDSRQTSPGLKWRIESSDKLVVATDRFSNAPSSGSANLSGDRLLALPAGNYSLVVESDTTSPGPGAMSTYAFRLLDLVATGSPQNLGSNSSVTFNHSLNPASAAAIYTVNVTNAGQSITVPAIANANAKIWVLDLAGNTLYRKSNYAGDSYTTPSTFSIIEPGNYLVLFDGDINESTTTGTASLTINSGSATVPNTPPTLTVGQTYTGTLTSNQTIEYLINLSGQSGWKPHYFDSLSTNNNVHWKLTAPSGVILADSKMDGMGTTTGTALSAKPFALAPGKYRLTITAGTVGGGGGPGGGGGGPEGEGAEGEGNSGDYSFRVLDMTTASSVSFNSSGVATLTAGSEPSYGAHIVRVPSSSLSGGYFRKLASGSSALWRVYAPSMQTRLDGTLATDGGVVPFGWHDLYVVVDAHNLTSGSQLYSIFANETVTQALSPTAMSNATFITSNHTYGSSLTHYARTNEYTFTITNPTNVYFEPSNASKQADADWTLVGPTGTIVNERLFSNSGGRVATGETSNFGLREGSYTLRIRSRAGNVGFRLIDLGTFGTAVNSGQSVSGTAGSTTPGARVYTFDGRQGDFNRITFNEPQNGPAQGVLRMRVIDPFGSTIATAIVPGPINYNPQTSVELKVDLPSTGRFMLIVDDVSGGDLTRNFSILRTHVSSYPVSVNSSITLNQTNAINVDSTKLLYDASITTPSTEFVYFDGLLADGTYPTQIMLPNKIGGRRLPGAHGSSDLFKFDTAQPLLVQTYTNSVPTTLGGTLGGAGFRSGSTPIIVVASDTWSDIR